MHRAEDVGCWLCAVRKMAGFGLECLVSLQPLARCDSSTFADTQSPAQRSPRHASAGRATDTTRIQTKALMPKPGSSTQALSAARATARVARGLPASLPTTVPLDLYGRGANTL